MNNIIKAKIKTLEEVLKIEWETDYRAVDTPWISRNMIGLFWNTYYTSTAGRWRYTIEWWCFKKEWVDIKETNYNITIKI